MRYFFIEKSSIRDQTAVIIGSDARHIKTVLRLKPGDAVGLFDGEGIEYRAEIASMARDRIHVSIIDSHPSSAESPVHITVAQAMLKGKKMDDLVRQVTELGVVAWIPFLATHSVPHPDHQRLAKRMTRWKTISHEALKQCRRGRATDIGPLSTFDAILTHGKDHDINLIFYENESTTRRLENYQTRKSIKKVLIMIGPEGGFAKEEVEQARSAGFVIVGLGPRILKAETATVAACSLVQYAFGDMGVW